MAEPGEDDLADRYDTACATLAAAGYRHYEVSNWAMDGWNRALSRPAARFGPPRESVADRSVRVPRLSTHPGGSRPTGSRSMPAGTT